MNYIQLVQRLAVEANSSGASPVTVVGQTGEYSRFVNWISTAWVDIQNLHNDWEWLRKSVSFSTATGKATYSPDADILLTDFASWKIDSFRIYPTSVGFGGERFLTKKGYNAWRDLYQFNNFRTTYSPPIEIAVAPDKSLCLGPTPDATGYTVVGEYFANPVSLTDDSDVPAMPSRFHMIIVYRALQMYAYYESAPEVMARANFEYARLVSQIEQDQMPIAQAGMALA